MSAADNIAKIGAGAKGVAVGVAVLAVVFIGFKLYKGVSQTAAAVGDVFANDLNPASDENIVYTSVNKVIGCGDGDCSLGTKIYDAVQWFKNIGGSD